MSHPGSGEPLGASQSRLMASNHRSEATRLAGEHLPITPSYSAIDVTAAGLEEIENHEDIDLSDTSFSHAVKVLSRSIAPAALGFLLEGALSIISVAVAGRLGPLELAIAGRGQAIQMFTGNIVTNACCCAQITLAAPLFTATKSTGSSAQSLSSAAEDDETSSLIKGRGTSMKSGMGVIAQRAFLVNMVASIPIILLWWYIAPVFRALGQPESLCAGLEEYMRVIIIGIPGYALLEIAKAFLQAQSIFHISPLLSLVYMPFHILITWALVHRTSLGVNGAPMAMLIAEYVIGTGTAVYISRSKSKECWGGWSKKAWSGWGLFLEIMLPAALSFGAECWCFEVVSLIAGTMGETAVAAQAAVSSLDLFMIMIPIAGGLTATARLGNLIGRSHAGIQAAVVTIRAVYLIMSVTGGISAALLIIFRDPLARIFTDDEETVEMIKMVLIPMAGYQVWDYLNSCGGSILRALAKQKFGAAVNLVAYYIIALPVGYYLAVTLDYGLPGMWYALNFGLFVVSMFIWFYYTFFINWSVEMDKAEERRLRGEE